MLCIVANNIALVATYIPGRSVTEQNVGDCAVFCRQKAHRDCESDLTPVFVNVGGQNVRGVEIKRKFVLGVGIAQRVTSALDAFVKTTHVPVDCHCLFRRQFDKLTGNKHGFFPVAIGKALGNFVERLLHPSAVFLDVAHFHRVVVDFAKVVQKPTDGNCFVGKGLVVIFAQVRLDEFYKAIVDVDGVVAKSTLLRCVKSCRGGRCKKVVTKKVVQQFVRTIAFDVRCVQCNKLVFESVNHVLLLWLQSAKLCDLPSTCKLYQAFDSTIIYHKLQIFNKYADISAKMMSKCCLLKNATMVDANFVAIAFAQNIV